jgi:hypothetical protein
VNIDEKLSKDREFKTKIRHEYWDWSISNKRKIAPTTFLTLHMGEIKPYWGPKYIENRNHETFETMDKVKMGLHMKQCHD